MLAQTGSLSSASNPAPKLPKLAAPPKAAKDEDGFDDEIFISDDNPKENGMKDAL